MDLGVSFLSSDSATLGALKRANKPFNSVDAVARLYFVSAESGVRCQGPDQSAVGVFVVHKEQREIMTLTNSKKSAGQ